MAALATSAHAQASGHVGISYSRAEGSFDSQFGSFESDVDAFAVEGTYATSLGSLGLQVDGRVTSSDYLDAISGTGHLNGRLGGVLVGGFVQATSINEADEEAWLVGAEAHGPLGLRTFAYGQLGKVVSDGPLDEDTWVSQLELRHFLSENFVVSGALGYVDTSLDDVGIQMETWSAGARAEYQFQATPWSLFAGYTYADTEGDGGGSTSGADSHTLQVGARFNFGGALLTRERAGQRLSAR